MKFKRKTVTFNGVEFFNAPCKVQENGDYLGLHCFLADVLGLSDEACMAIWMISDQRNPEMDQLKRKEQINKICSELQIDFNI